MLTIKLKPFSLVQAGYKVLTVTKNLQNMPLHMYMYYIGMYSSAIPTWINKESIACNC